MSSSRLCAFLLACVALVLSPTFASASPCDSTAVYPIAPRAGQRPAIAITATSSAATARWYIADTLTGACLGYVGTSGTPRVFVTWTPTLAFARTSDTAVATRDAAVTQLLARVGGLRHVDSTPAVLVRFDSAATGGALVISSGLPLPPGQLWPTQLDQVHVLVGGFEQAIGVRALAGRHADGSLRAVYIQLRFVLASAAPVQAVIRFGGARPSYLTRADATLSATAPVPTAALLPTDPAYLISTGLGGELLPASAPCATPLLAAFVTDYVAAEADDWRRGGPAWNGNGRTAGYDRGFTLYQQWLRTGDPTYFAHALAVVDNYVRGYVVPNSGIVPWYAESRSVALAYLLTGHEPYRLAVRKISENLVWQQRPGLVYWVGAMPNKGDDRSRARLLEGALDAAMIDASDPATASPATMFTPFLTRTTLDSVVGLILHTQAPNGQFGGTDYAGGQKAYMVGLLLSALARYHDEVTPDARIPIAVRRATDYLWATEWVPSVQGFKYVTKTVSTEDQDTPQPSLNTLIAPAFAWLYQRDGLAADRDALDAMLAGQYTARPWWMTNGKSFDQTYSLLFNVAAQRAR